MTEPIAPSPAPRAHGSGPPRGSSAPPDRFEAALGTAIEAGDQSPPDPPATATTRTAQAEGHTAESDSHRPDTTKDTPAPAPGAPAAGPVPGAAPTHAAAAEQAAFAAGLPRPPLATSVAASPRPEAHGGAAARSAAAAPAVDAQPAHAAPASSVPATPAADVTAVTSTVAAPATAATPEAAAPASALHQGRGRAGREAGTRDRHARPSLHAAAAADLQGAREAVAGHARRTARRAAQGGATAPAASADRATAQPAAPVAATDTARRAADAPTDAAPVETAGPRAGVRMHEVADATRATLRVSVRDGVTQARIKLHPEDLGEIEIRLSYHDGGVSAHVAAHSAAAVDALVQAGGDLRRSLEAQGVVVHQLDVQLAGEDRRPGSEDRGHGAAHAAQGGRRGEAAAEEPEITIEASSLPLAGSQVDVLA